ncbi:uncharacterized protein NPIL_102841 [Nephila pilipes]|uniref:Uncharacterized protein n=1 Tax=Nephila pilipes TaxID=299642 RepID=A0A8X6QF98_NEPPI|nr:uncharacterized protein NPIL_102841 [Nephila pilipes]
MFDKGNTEKHYLGKDHLQYSILIQLLDNKSKKKTIVTWMDTFVNNRYQNASFYKAFICEKVNMHRLLYELAHATEKALSPISLLIFSSQCLFMYISLAYCIVFQFKDRYFAILWYVISSSVLPLFSVVGVILCASKISEEIVLIRTNLQLLYNTWVNESDADNKILLLMRTMITTKFPNMTAGNIMDLKLGLIFSLFGSLFTYGLLILSVTNS